MKRHGPWWRQRVRVVHQKFKPLHFTMSAYSRLRRWKKPILFLIIGTGLCVSYLMARDAVGQARLAAQVSSSSCHLKQLGMALHNYHSTYDSFPPGGIIRENGEQMVSWQTLLLPHLNLQSLYNQIKRDEPWTSPENQRAYSTHIPVCQHPGLKGDGPLTHYAGNSHVFLTNRSLKMSDFKDGTSNTMMIGEVSAGFKAWGDPTNTRDPLLGLGQTPHQFGGSFFKMTLIGMADGSAHQLPNNVDRKALKALATPDGDESPADFWDHNPNLGRVLSSPTSNQ